MSPTPYSESVEHIPVPKCLPTKKTTSGGSIRGKCFVNDGKEEADAETQNMTAADANRNAVDTFVSDIARFTIRPNVEFDEPSM